MFDVNNYFSFAVHGAAGGHGEGVASSVEQFLTFLETLSDKPAADIFTAIMPGISAMENIHPLLVHFPIAFFSAFVLIDIAGSVAGKQSWRQAAGWFLYCGTIMAIVTVIAGLQAAESVAHGENVHDIMERHEHLGITVLVWSSVLSLWRIFSRGVIKDGANVFYLTLVALLGVLVVFTADLGGLMVYHYGVSVSSENTTMMEYFSEHQHSH